MSHPTPTVWRWFEWHAISKWNPTTGDQPGVSCIEKAVARGPGIREFTPPSSFQTLPTTAEAYAYLIVRGVPLDKIELIDSRPPCVFCHRYLDDHDPGFFGEHCRPYCHVSGCGTVTCVQALVGGYLPTCLQHAFTDRLWVLPGGVYKDEVQPRPGIWRVQEEVAKCIRL